VRRENPPYGLLARFYDDILAGIEGMNRAARGKMLGKSIGVVRSACDLACGSGETALDLARRGVGVHAVDLSPEFCRIARRKARREGLRLNVLRADMRDFRLPGPVDLVTCEFAALNNLSSPRDLEKVFRSVSRVLRPGGVFLFDVNTDLSLREQCTGTHWFEGEGFKLVLRGRPDGRLRVRLDCDWFLPSGSLWKHVRETYWNIGWTDREVRRALRKAGLALLRFEDGMDVRPKGFVEKRGYDAYYLTKRL
jgi:SAM-dependent methyltransferase